MQWGLPVPAESLKQLLWEIWMIMLKRVISIDFSGYCYNFVCIVGKKTHCSQNVIPCAAASSPQFLIVFCIVVITTITMISKNLCLSVCFVGFISPSKRVPLFLLRHLQWEHISELFSLAVMLLRDSQNNGYKVFWVALHLRSKDFCFPWLKRNRGTFFVNEEREQKHHS